MRRAALLAMVLVAAGCGATKHVERTGTVQKPPPGRLLYAGGAWGVTTSGGHATAWHLVRGTWHAERSSAVRIDVLGPKPGTKVAAIPQVAMEVKARKPLIETALWVDGVLLEVKGGGLDPREGTIYGAPANALKPGTHTAVGYGRTATHAFAVAWSFRT